MSLSFSNVEYSSLGNRRVVICRITFDASYPLGGESFIPGDLRMRQFDFCLFESRDGYLFEYDYTDEKLKAVFPRGAVDDTFLAELDEGEIAVTSIAGNGMIISTSGEPGIVGGVGSEVDDETDLSQVKDVRAFIVGY